MASRKIAFVGTPVSGASDGNSSALGDARYGSRRRQIGDQMVRDEQGRRRFHGAFTGGFTAGYHGTVGSVEGFRPRSFVSHRSDPSRTIQKDCNKYSHRPEDYMDDEDFSEFGIAPKKIRVNEVSMHDDLFPHDNNHRRLDVCHNSIGEKILKQLTCGPDNSILAVRPVFSKKSDYHGLGYQGLKKSSEVSDGAERRNHKSINPIIASVGLGKTLKISGSAFGLGVMPDDDDQEDMIEEYEVDNPNDYQLRSHAPDKYRDRARIDKDRFNEFPGQDNGIPGFELFKLSEYSDRLDPIKDLFPDPSIPIDWNSPTLIDLKQLEIDPERSEHAIHEQYVKLSSKFEGKFTSSTTNLKSLKEESGSGLINLTDIRSKESVHLPHRDVIQDKLTTEPITIERGTVEWRPCSLLCKRFNVPNPFPGSQYCGVQLDHPSKEEHINESSTVIESSFLNLAPLKIRESIFNTKFCLEQSDTQLSDICSQDSDEQPQVLSTAEHTLCQDNSRENIFREHPLDRDSEQSPEVIVYDAPKQEPELIILSSSDSSFDATNLQTRNDEAEEDAYGPPLPPIYSSMGTNFSKSRSKPKKKKKKHKKHKSMKRLN